MTRIVPSTLRRAGDRAIRARTVDAFDDALLAHDRALAAARLVIWLGAEPTFTDAASSAPGWLGAADGDGKRARGAALARALRREGQAFVRTLGRQYPGEPAPRWSFGIYALRSGVPLWDGPLDPACLDAPSGGGDPRALRDALVEALGAKALDVPGPLPHRLVLGEADAALLSRPPLEGRPIPPGGLVDPVAARGARLVALGSEDGHVALELPAFESVDLFVGFLGVVAAAARALPLDALILRGYPPPVDDRVAFTTVTPDPGVVEVNMAPCRSATELHHASRAIHAAAAAAELSPARRQYNGEVTDSGGGGHLTFGGPRPEASPFFAHPHLLPRLVAYLSRHPSLSYFFAGRAVGGSGQAVRPDEQARESFEELAVALDRLARAEAPSPERLAGALAPLLTDRFGNTHRSEVNVEKLWSPWIGERGRLGLVELRALRQAPSPAHEAARAALFRAVLARLAARPYPIGLIDHGADLHDRFALPFFLALDLDDVLDELGREGFGLGAPLVAELADDAHRVVGVAALDGGVRLEVRRAIEHWPLVGDLSREAGTSRLVDSSTTRLELRLVGPELHRVQVGVRLNGASHRLPMILHQSRRGVAAVFGVRYRSFAPSPGLHPDLAPLDPLALDLRGPEDAVHVSVHAWIPGGGVYPGLPADDAEAARRRAERFVVEPAHGALAPMVAPPRAALSRYALDTRRVV
ncbi:MAG: transglutaminase family protein [Sandaracinaceae bacterium]|nr:transglutaminase family protein [Sandaracinaceae bacterium]